ncbi:MAG: hypothetical protein MI757_14660, partial [Pirellulales bacterium]|nr:hypothetical protein [Pirellulales bacterium]
GFGLVAGALALGIYFAPELEEFAAAWRPQADDNDTGDDKSNDRTRKDRPKKSQAKPEVPQSPDFAVPPEIAALSPSPEEPPEKGPETKPEPKDVDVESKPAERPEAETKPPKTRRMPRAKRTLQLKPRPDAIETWEPRHFTSAKRDADPRLVAAVRHVIKTESNQSTGVDKLLAALTHDQAAAAEWPKPVSVILDDELPPGSVTYEHAFTFLTGKQHPIKFGKRVLRQVAKPFAEQKSDGRNEFEEMENRVRLNDGDTIFVHVLIDSDASPESLLFGIQTEDGWRGVYYGADSIQFCEKQQAGGDLPFSDQWQRLGVEASDLGLVGKSVSGLAFLQDGGTVYWDYAGVERGRNDDALIPEIVAALGTSKAAAAGAAFRDVITGKFPTRLPAEEATALALKEFVTVAATPHKDANVDATRHARLSDAVFVPSDVLGTDAGSELVERLQTLATGKLLAASKGSVERRLSLAVRLAKAESLPLAVENQILDVILKDEPANFEARLALFRRGKLEASDQESLMETIAAMSEAVLRARFGFPQEKPNSELGKLASADAGRTLGQRVWSRDLRGKAVDRVADSRDAATSRSAFRWVATMPLQDARRALYQHFTAVAHRQKPTVLEQLGLLDSQFVDPALLVILKNTWHAPGVAPIKR